MPTQEQQDWIMDPSDSQCFLKSQVSTEVAEIMKEYGNFFKRLEENKIETMNNLVKILSKYHKGILK